MSSVVTTIVSETEEVVNALGDEAVLVVKQTGLWARVLIAGGSVLNLVIAVLIVKRAWILSKSRKFTWVWPSPYAQAAPEESLATRPSISDFLEKSVAVQNGLPKPGAGAQRQRPK